MSSPSQPPDRIDSHSQDGTQSREPAQPRRTASANDLNQSASLQTIRLADGPGSGHVLVNREWLSNDVRGRADQGPQTETLPQSSEQRPEDARMRHGIIVPHRRVQRHQRHMDRTMRVSEQQQQDALRPERARLLDIDLQRLWLPAFGQDAPLNSTQQPAQSGRPRSYMPSLRSQPEFYMTGVTAVDTAAEPVANDAECTICLEPLSDDVVKFQACGHMFHTVCVQSWFDQSAPRTGHKRGTCPNCRHELYEPDPRFGRTAPPQNVELPVIGRGQLHPISSPNREPFGHREEAAAIIRPSNSDRRRQANDGIQRRLVGVEQQERAEQALAVTPQQYITNRRTLQGEPIRIDRRPRAVALEHVRNDPPAQEDADSLPQRTSSLPHGGAIRRQQASEIMTDALRINESPRNSQLDNGRANSDTSDHVSNVGGPSGTPSTPLGASGTPTPTVNTQSVQPRESRATLATRAIAQRRSLLLEPDLNNRDADPPQTVRRSASSSQHTTANGNRDPIWLPDFHGHPRVINPQPELTPTERAIRDLQQEQSLLLDRLREVQDQLGRHLQAADASRERTTVVRRPAPNHFPREAQDDLSTGRPPPIAIPHLADPAFPDLRSAREFPDRRAIGSGISIWSADYVSTRERNNETQAPGRLLPSLSNHSGNRPTAEPPARISSSNEEISSSLVSTYPATSSDQQPASADNLGSRSRFRQRAGEVLERISREQADMERLISNSMSLDQSLVPALTDDDTPEAPQ